MNVHNKKEILSDRTLWVWTWYQFNLIPLLGKLVKIALQTQVSNLSPNMNQWNTQDNESQCTRSFSNFAVNWDKRNNHWNSSLNVNGHWSLRPMSRLKSVQLISIWSFGTWQFHLTQMREVETTGVQQIFRWNFKQVSIFYGWRNHSLSKNSLKPLISISKFLNEAKGKVKWRISLDFGAKRTKFITNFRFWWAKSIWLNRIEMKENSTLLDETETIETESRY